MLGVTNTIELEERVRMTFSFWGIYQQSRHQYRSRPGKTYFLVIEQSPLYSPVRLIF